MSKDLEFDLDDDWGLDDDLDMEMDFMPGASEVPEGRDAIMAMPKTAAKSAAKAIAGPDKRRKLILDSLPKDYTLAADAYDTVAREGRDLYRTAKKELTTTKRDLQRATKEAMPAMKKYLPEGITKRVEKWATKDDVPNYAGGDVDPRESAIGAMLDDTFSAMNASNEQQREQEGKDRIESDIKDKADSIRQDSLNSIITNIRGDTANLVAYNKSSDKYRRKLLEVNWRQYYVLTDMLESQRASMERVIPNLDAIVKNTALPDYAKEQFSEVTRAMMTRELIERISPGSFARDYISNLGKNVKTAVTDFGSSAREAISMGSMMAEAAGDDGFGESAPLSPAQERAQAMQSAAGMAGGMFAKKYITPHINKLTTRMRDAGEDNETIAGLGGKLRQIRDLPEYLNDLVRRNDNGELEGAESTFASLVSSILPTYGGDSANMANITAEELSQSVPYSRKTDITVNEVIPGWLSTINDSINFLADRDVPRERFDYTSGTFVKENDILDRINENVEDNSTREYMRDRIDEMLKEIEAAGLEAGNEVLSDTARESLGRVIDEKVRKVGRFNIDELANEDSAYGNQRYEESVFELQEYFSNINDMDTVAKNKLTNETGDRIRELRNIVDPIQEVIDRMQEQYGSDALVKAGVFKLDDYGVPQLNKDIMSSYADATPKRGGDPRQQTADIVRNTAEMVANSDTPINRMPTPEQYAAQESFLQVDTDKLRQTIEETSNATVDGIRYVLYGEEETNLVQLLKNIAKEPNTAASAHGLNDIVNSIHEQLVANNLKPELEAILEMMEDMLISGIPSNGTVVDGMENMARSATGYFGKAGKHARGLFSSAKSGLSKVKNTITSKLPKFSTLNDTLQSGIDGAKSTLGSLRDGIMNYADIRDGEGNIVLFGKKIKAGEYFDADGKVITKIKDITGAIYDKDGNIVISKEEIMEKFDSLTYNTKQGWKKLSSGAGRLLGQGIGKALSIPPIVMKGLNDVGNYLVKQVRTGKDIYVKGEQSPRLQRKLMLEGFYIDRNTGKPIYDVKDITGPVLNKYKEVVITQEELDDPDVSFVDVDGNEFTSFLAKAKARATNAFSWGKDKFINIKDKLLEYGGAAKDWMMGLFGEDGFIGKKFESFSFGNGKVVDKLSEIYDLLNDRLNSPMSEMDADVEGRETEDTIPEAEEKVAGDTDGDGTRDNGYKEIFEKRKADAEKRKAKREADKKERKANKKERDPSKGFFSSLTDGLMSGLGGLKSLFMGLGGSMAGVFASKALGMLSDGMGSIAGKLFGSKTPVGGATAKKGILRKGASLVGKVASSVYGAGKFLAVNAVRTAGMAAIGVVSSPVLLASAAVAAVGYGIYSYVNRTEGVLTRLRLASYGTKDYTDGSSDEVVKLLNLEALLADYTAYNNEGISSIRGVNDKVTAQIAEMFEVDTESPEHTERFRRWLYGRFFPQYLLWTTRVKQANPTASMEEIDTVTKVTAKQQLKILDGVTLPVDHPTFTNMQSPFSDGGIISGAMSFIGLGYDTPSDMMSGPEVKEVEAEAREHITALVAKEAKLEKRNKRGADANNTAKANDDTPKGELPNAESRPVTRNTSNDDVDTGNVNVSARRKRRGSTASGNANADKVTTTASNLVQASRDSSRLNAIEAIRLRAYGLVDLDPALIDVLWELESHVYGQMTVINGTVTVDVDVEKDVKLFMAAFGLNATLESDVEKWSMWYRGRFVTVLSKFIAEMSRHAGKVDPLTVRVTAKASYLLKVGRAVVSAHVETGGDSISVWSLTTSPFASVSILNSDPTSVDGNLLYIEELIRVDTSTEQRSTRRSRREKALEISNGSSAVAKSRKERTSGSDNAVANDTANTSPAGMSTIPVGEMTEGVDGDGAYNRIKATGTGRAEIAQMIKEVSKATGVDENLLLTVGMLESTLNPSAGAQTSSAKGLYQFINSTWKETLDKHGNRYGIPDNASPYDPVANALMGAEYLKSGAKRVSGSLPTGANAGPVDLYLAHFLGGGGASKFLRNLHKTPNRIAAKDFTAAAKANRSVFIGNGKLRTYGEIYEYLQQRASKSFSYVAKYATNPTLEQPSLTAMNEDGVKGLMANTVNTVTTAPEKEAIQKTYAAKQVDTAVSKVKSSTGASTSTGVGGGAVATSEAVIKDLVKAPPTVTDKDDRESYESVVKEAVQTRIDKTKDEFSTVANGMVKSQLETSMRSHVVLESQLEVLKEMAVTLNHISEKTAFKGTPSQAQQLERKQAQELAARQQQTITHGRGPISTRRIVT